MLLLALAIMLVFGCLIENYARPGNKEHCYHSEGSRLTVPELFASFVMDQIIFLRIKFNGNLFWLFKGYVGSDPSQNVQLNRKVIHNAQTYYILLLYSVTYQTLLFGR